MSDYIPEDNLVLIFKHLPVKTLLRFRCVSKHWKQIIDCPTFAQHHLSIQKPQFLVDPRRRVFLVVDPLPRPSVITLSKPIEALQYLLFGTLHGLVCLSDQFNLVIWNPSLRKSFSLPFPSGFRWYTGRRLQTCYGFWFDPSTKEFKAIVLQRMPRVKCILYSSIRNGWSVVPTGKVVKWMSCEEGPPVMIGEVAHWGGSLDGYITNDHLSHRHENKEILSFDFVQESFDFIEFSCIKCRNYATCRWQGAISLVCWEIVLPQQCEIYSRQEDSWVKMFCFEFHQPIVHAFWVTEDVEERNKRGKRKRDVEDTLGGVRVLATVTNELMLHGTKTGCRTLRKGLGDFDKVTVAYDFVESLLFP